MVFAVVAGGLRYPQSPLWLADGSLLVLESARGTLSHVSIEGDVNVVAELGGAPYGAAFGPDGLVYVCNNGAVAWSEVDGVPIPGLQAEGYVGGTIQRVDPSTGEVEVLYDEADGIRLRGPHQLVFDSSGGFWVTDAGKLRPRERDRGGLYYAQADGSGIKTMVFPLEAPVGVALAPDQDVLYVSDALQGRVYEWALSGPGEIAGYFGWQHRGALLADPEGGPLFGAMAADRLGNLCVATMRAGGVTVVTPDGVHRRHPIDDPLVTSVAFGGVDGQTLYTTEGGSRLVATRWEIAGAEPAFGSNGTGASS